MRHHLRCRNRNVSSDHIHTLFPPAFFLRPRGRCGTGSPCPRQIEVAESALRMQVLEEQAAWAVDRMREAAFRRLEAEKGQLLGELRQLQRDVNDLSDQLEEEQQRGVELEALLEERQAQLAEGAVAQAQAQNVVGAWEAALEERVAIVSEEQAEVLQVLEWHQSLLAEAASAAPAVALRSAVEQEESEARWVLEQAAMSAVLELVSGLHVAAVARMQLEGGWEEWGAEIEEGQQQTAALQAQQQVANTLQEQLRAVEAEHAALQEEYASAMAVVGSLEVAQSELAQRLALQQAEQSGRMDAAALWQAALRRQVEEASGSAREWALASEGATATYQREVEEVARSTEMLIERERAGWQVVASELAGRLAVQMEESEARWQLCVPSGDATVRVVTAEAEGIDSALQPGTTLFYTASVGIEVCVWWACMDWFILL